MAPKSQDGVAFECSICGSVHDSRGGVKTHIGHTRDEQHNIDPENKDEYVVEVGDDGPTGGNNGEESDEEEGKDGDTSEEEKTTNNNPTDNPLFNMPEDEDDTPDCPECGNPMHTVSEGTKVSGYAEGENVSFESDGDDYVCHKCDNLVVTGAGQVVY